MTEVRVITLKIFVVDDNAVVLSIVQNVEVILRSVVNEGSAHTIAPDIDGCSAPIAV